MKSTVRSTGVFALTIATLSASNLSGPLYAQITALTGDVTATGPGSVAATVNSVGASSAANVHTAEQNANAVLTAAGSTGDLLSVGNGAFNIWPGETGTVHHNVAIGPGAYNLYAGVGTGGGTNDVEDSVAIGYNAGNSLTTGFDGAATQGVAIGSGATNSYICGNYQNFGPIAIGYQATGGCQAAIAIGWEASHWGADSIGIGGNIVGRSFDSILMGRAATDNTSGGPWPGIALGNHAAIYAAGQAVFGGDQDVLYGGITDMFIGPPVTNWSGNGGTPQPGSINPCGGGLGHFDTGSGNDQPGCSLSVNGGRGSGAGAGGPLYFKTAPAGASGSSQNALVTRMSIDQNGVFTLSPFGAGIGHFSPTGVLSSSAVNLASADVAGLLPNSNLANPSITVNGTTCVLGSSCTPPQTTGGSSAQFENQTPGTGITNVSITAGAGQAANSLLDIRNNGGTDLFSVSSAGAVTASGPVTTSEVVVTATPWADYVFDPDYPLAPLSEVAHYIAVNHHLPEIPSAAEVESKGVSLGEMQAKLLAKIEELTLHMIAAEKENRDLRARVSRLEASTAARAQ